MIIKVDPHSGRLITHINNKIATAKRTGDEYQVEGLEQILAAVEAAASIGADEIRFENEEIGFLL